MVWDSIKLSSFLRMNGCSSIFLSKDGVYYLVCTIYILTMFYCIIYLRLELLPRFAFFDFLTCFLFFVRFPLRDLRERCFVRPPKLYFGGNCLLFATGIFMGGVPLDLLTSSLISLSYIDINLALSTGEALSFLIRRLISAFFFASLCSDS